MSTSWYDVQEVLPDVVQVNDGDLDTSYILRGRERTGVIDTGMGIGDLATVVAETSPLKPLVINTHAHPDHWQGNYQFAETSMGAEEWALVQRQQATRRPRPAQPDGRRPTPLDFIGQKRPLPPGFDIEDYRPDRIVPPTYLWQEGDVIELGGFRLEVLHIPAHTLGSIALLERERRLLFTGDTVLRGTIWLHLDGSAAPEVAFATYERLAALADQVDHLLPAHGTAILPASFLTELYAGTRRIRRGEIAPRYMETFAGNGWFYDFGGYGMLFRNQIPGDLG